MKKKRMFCVFLSLICVIPLLSGFTFAAADNKKEEENQKQELLRLPIIMYHKVVPDKCKPNMYSIRISDLEEDLDYIKSQGYTTVLPRDLTAYSEGKADLPEKPIMLTFDDGFYGVKSLALEKLIERGQKAVVAIVGDFIDKGEESPDNNLYSYLTLPQIVELHNSGHFEIASHSHSLHYLRKRKGIKKLPRENIEDYKKFFAEDALALQQRLEKHAISPVSYAFPFGYYDRFSNALLEELGFKITFTCTEKVNLICREKPCLYGLNRFNRSGVGKTAQVILERNDK